MEYKVYEADPILKGIVRCFWSLDMPASDKLEKQRIVPDGCMELIIHYGDLFRQYKNDSQNIIQPRSFVFGQITQQLEIAPMGITGVMAARFEPDGFIPFTSKPLKDMENEAIPLKSIFGDSGIELEKEVLNASNNLQRKSFIENFLLRLLQTNLAINRICKSSVALLLQTYGQVNVGQMAESLNINRRLLERRFALEVGMSPKQFSKIIRFQKVLNRMNKNDFDRFTDVAYDHGYYDQAHFIKDFKEFTGMSPKQFYADNLKMAALFSGSD